MADEHSQPQEQAHYQQQQAKKSPILAITVVIVVILVIVAGFYVWTSNSAGPKDPFEEQIIEIDGYFNGLDGIATKGPVTHRIGYRISPIGHMSYADRLYVGSGDGSPPSPYGIYAYDPDDGTRVWNLQAFQTNSQISTDVVVENFGSKTNSQYAENRIFFGCEDGSIYALKDDFDTVRSGYPPYSGPGDNVAFVWKATLDGVPSGKIAVWQNNSLSRYATHSEYDANDIIFASTSDGTLYAFQGPLYDYDTINHRTNRTYPTLFWSTHLSDYPLTAPTLSPNGQYIFVGSSDGQLHGILVATGEPIPEWGGSTYTVSDNSGFSSPVCVGSDRPIIYTTTENGYLHSVWGSNGTARAGWEGGLQVINSENVVDGGELTEPSVFAYGSTIIFGSSTGYVYNFDSDGELKACFDTSLGIYETECIVAPHLDYSGRLFVVANCLNGTDEPSDDYTYLYAVAGSNATWRLEFDGKVLASPISYNPAGLEHHLYIDVVFASVSVDSDGSLSAGRMYSFANTGMPIRAE